MKSINVLSIDFDYFQNVKKQTMLTCYPDSHDLPTELTILTWASHYANPDEENKIYEVTVKEDKIEELKDIIVDNCDETAVMMAANSHEHIYDFIKDVMEKKNADAVNVVNIDMHHDYFTDEGTELNCGNWVAHVLHDIKGSQVEWIANPISKEVYALEDGFELKTRMDFKKLWDMSIDAVFLCRSDTWLPPHLDNVFDDFLYFLADVVPDNLVEQSISEPREFEEYVQEEKKMRQKAIKRLEKIMEKKDV